MNRINAIFKSSKAAQSGVLMPFLTAGYPSLNVTKQLLMNLKDSGASICEIGFPFSDPIADGPVIQASMTEALKQKITPDQIFETVKSVRDSTDLGLVAMVSYSIVYRIGVEAFIKQSKDAGFDGFIFPDLPLEEAEQVSQQVSDADMTCSLLISPTTPLDRVQKIVSLCSGFVYILARTGITGERTDLPADLKDRLEAIKQMTDLPLAVGFGISQAEHVRTVTSEGDAAIVGSAIVKKLTEKIDATEQEQINHTLAFVKELSKGITE